MLSNYVQVVHFSTAPVVHFSPALDTLASGHPRPTQLHTDLLRLYPADQPIRLVTTNFDMLFEQAADEVCDSKPEIFGAPALPLGSRFNGIVHVHGTVDRAEDMVLTDSDFGRAYLTEGWARRFVLDLFNSYTVLFVGYSHSDVVMNYLARALPPTGSQRFALTNNAEGGAWQALGIEPIAYASSSPSDHQQLYEGVNGLATYMRRGILDWQREISEIASGPPPLDEETQGIIDVSLSDPIRTRFFTEAASSSDWIGWLYGRQHLDSLFRSGELSESQRILASWLASTFSASNPDWLFLLIRLNAGQLNETFWFKLVAASCRLEPENNPTDRATFARWVSVLLHTSLETRPFDELNDSFFLLARGCIDLNLSDSLINIFRKLSTSRLSPGGGLAPFEPKPRGQHYMLNEIWDRGLRPNLGTVARSVLEVAVESLNNYYVEYLTWRNPGHDFDPVSADRWAIEPSEFDAYPDSIDVLIDAARDCLEYISSQSTSEISQWRERLSSYDAPILWRLAVHVLLLSDDLSADDKIEWLLSKTWTLDMRGNNEVLRVVEAAYPDAGTDLRSSFVKAVISYRPMDSEGQEDEHLTARYHYEWLSVLRSVAPGCLFAESATTELLQRHPDLAEAADPGPPTIWETLEATSPLPVSELSKPLLSNLKDNPTWPDDGRILSKIGEASDGNFDWSLELADTLSASGNWKTPIWKRLLRAWARDLQVDTTGQMLGKVEDPELLQRHPREVAEILYAFVNASDHSEASMDLLEITNRIARDLWTFLAPVKPSIVEGDWLLIGINHPAGTVAQYWCQSHSLWKRHREPEAAMFSANYREALTGIIEDRTLAGLLGRCVLARNLAYLFGTDEEWTKDHLLPLFEEQEDEEEHRAAWHGFLYGPPVSPTAVRLLERPLLNAAAKLRTTFPDDRIRPMFVRHFTGVMAYFVEDPTVEWMPRFYKEASSEDRRLLGLSINSVLRGMTAEQQLGLWDRWLSRHWGNRIRGIPAPLDSGETDAMIRWLPRLDSVFADAVEYAIQMPPTPLQQNPIISELAEGDLWLKHPGATARLLAHLAESESSHWFWHNGKELFDRLADTSLAEDNRMLLEEIRAKLGV